MVDLLRQPRTKILQGAVCSRKAIWVLTTHSDFVRLIRSDLFFRALAIWGHFLIVELLQPIPPGNVNTVAVQCGIDKKPIVTRPLISRVLGSAQQVVDYLPKIVAQCMTSSQLVRPS